MTFPMRGAVAAALATVVVAAAPSARAQRAGVLVYARPGAPVAATTVTAELDKASGTTALVAQPFAVAAQRLAAGAIPARRLADFVRARQLMAEGWRAYLGVEAQFAAARLAAARATATKVLDLDGGRELFGEISLRLAVVRYHLKQAAQAGALFRLAAALQPTRGVTVAEFAPDVVAAYTRAVAVQPPQVSVQLQLVGAGGRRVRGPHVVVDGKPVAATGMLTLTAGQHVIVAGARGFRSRGQVFAVDASTHQLRLQLDFDPARAAVWDGRAALGIGTGEEAARRAVTGLVRFGELDSVMLVASVWRRGGPALLGQACAGLPVRCTRVVELRFPRPAGVAAAARELWRLLVAELSRARFPPTLLEDARLVDQDRGKTNGQVGNGTKRPWWRNPWLWVGAGAVATAVGAAVLLTRDTEVSPVFDIRPCDFGGCL